MSSAKYPGSTAHFPVSDLASSVACPDAALMRALRSFIHGRVDQHADGEDIAQETLLRLLGYPAARIDNLKALCFAIARNLLLDHHRTASRRAPAELNDDMVCPQPTADHVLAFRRAVAILAQALDRMPPLRREIFLRKRVDGVSTADIAHSLDMSVAAVEKHVVRALNDLRTAMAKRGFTMDGGA
ncbi:RNA polymerase sigma factor [Sphingomonadaceae bacterium jetA1]|uniref:RNA polymerase sigma factor n=1 Tax=Facivitalis istanbulensis TaxID=3075838 RepID=UPI00346C1FA7